MSTKNNIFNSSIYLFLLNQKYRILGFLIVYCTFGILLNFQNELVLKLFPKKIWIHRVNSIEKLNEVHKKFTGIELDIVYNIKSHSFDVNHPPTPSINLSLIEYLSAIKPLPRNKFWLDFKNLSQENALFSLKRLNTLCKKLHLDPEQFIVEAKTPSHLISFRKIGYKTSYYLPDQINHPNNNLLIHQIKRINSVNPTDYISSGRRDYHLIKKEFPDQKILTWSFNYSERKSIAPYQLLRKTRTLYSKLKILSDDNVIIVLFGYKAKKGNR